MAFVFRGRTALVWGHESGRCIGSSSIAFVQRFRKLFSKRERLDLSWCFRRSQTKLNFKVANDPLFPSARSLRF
jgi:hypothetical protein